MSKIVYHTDSQGVKLALALALEVTSKTGLEHESIILDTGQTIAWNKHKAILYLKGLITEKELADG